MDIHDTDGVVRFVEQVVDDNIINRIAGKLKGEPHYEVTGLLQQSGTQSVERLARKMFNIYKDQLGRR